MAAGERQRRFEALLRQHQRIVFKIAATYARTTQDRDDLAQEIATQLWRSFPRFDARRARFSTWLYRVALNVAISSLRTDGRDARGRGESLEDAPAEVLADPGDPHDVQIERAQHAAALRAFLGKLDPLNRALVLLYLEGRSYAEIADVLGISETNVATKLNRVRQRLRSGIADGPATGVKNGTR